MNKFLLLIFLLMVGYFANAQYLISGTVRNASGTPLSKRPVYVRADTTVNPKWFSSFYLQDSTDTSGVYSITMPSSVTTGMQVIVSVVNCNSVLLTKTYVYAGSNITSDFTICVTPAPTITGQVSMGNGSTRAPNAKLQLITKYLDTVIGSTSYYKLQPIDSVVASSNGGFAFSYPTNTSADLLVRASFQSFSGFYSKFAPTYYNNVNYWPLATNLPANTSSTPSIIMKPVSNPGGPGTVSGFVVVGAGKTTAVGDPVPNRLILLADTLDNIMGFTLSANDGTFGFYGVPYGQYKIYGDVLSKTSQPLYFTLSASNPVAAFITFEDKVRTFNPKMPPTAIAGMHIPAVSIAPNPAKDKLIINSAGTDCSAAIYDVAGRLVMNNIQLRAGYINEVNISTLPQGSYILQVATDKGREAFKFIKE